VISISSGPTCPTISQSKIWTARKHFLRFDLSKRNNFKTIFPPQESLSAFARKKPAYYSAKKTVHLRLPWSKVAKRINQAKETFKRYTSREKWGVLPPYISLRFPGTYDICYFQNIFLFPTSILITFTTESYLSNEIYIVAYTHATHCTTKQLLFSFKNFICAWKRQRHFRSVFST